MKKLNQKSLQKALIALAAFAFLAAKCGKSEPAPPVDPPAPRLPIEVWTTAADQSKLLAFRTLDFSKNGKDTRFSSILIDTTKALQGIDGFGFTLTGGSAFLLQKMDATARAGLLQAFFGKSDSSIVVSFLRLSLGASDLDAAVFSYNDLPAGQTDPDLLQFSLAKDDAALVPVLKEILAINPDIQLMASPWSPPTWMKTNGSSVGGGLKPAFYGVYAKYFVKYVEAMKSRGITIGSVTIQNEPQHGGNNPSCVFSAAESAEFVKNHLGPAFSAAGLATKIIVWDHNCDRPDYPIAILDDPAAKAFVAGSAFHLYAGDVSAMSAVHERHPDRDLFFTEQWTGKNGSFDGDLMWHTKNVIIGTMRNWSRVALEWNLANDPNFEPHTPGGCTECRGAVTIDGSKATKNVAFYIIAHASKFVPPGSVRLSSNASGAVQNVAFRRPDGKIAVIVLNETDGLQTFNLGTGGRWLTASLAAKTVGTIVF